MNDPHIMSAVMATGGLLVISVLSKVLNESSSDDELGQELLDRAIEWKQYAEDDTAPLAKLQHAIYSSAYLHAARAASKDSDLERSSGIDLRKLKRSSEQDIKSSLQDIIRKCPKFKGQIVTM